MRDGKGEAGMDEQVVAFMLGSEEYGIEISRVREIIVYKGATPMPKAPAYMDGIVDIRGMIIPVIDLGAKLSVATNRDEAEGHALVVECGEQQVALRVDRVTEVRFISETQIEWTDKIEMPGNKGDRSIRGVGKIDGQLCILLDVDQLFSQAEWAKLGETVAE